jgi:hypothetical protein
MWKKYRWLSRVYSWALGIPSFKEEFKKNKAQSQKAYGWKSKHSKELKKKK